MAREFRGGYYKMDHVSFGKMMVSEQLRRPLSTVSRLIAGVAKANTLASSGTPDANGDGNSLANSYEAERGPIVVVRGQGGEPGPRITNRVVNRMRHAAVREFGKGGYGAGRGTRDLRRAGARFGDVAGERG